MPKKRKPSNYNKKIGLTPGTIVYTGEKANDLFIDVFEYNAQYLKEHHFQLMDEILFLKESKLNVWININGLNHTKSIDQIGQHYGIHPLVLEDIVNTSQRPKIADYGDYLFIVSKMLNYDQQDELKSEQVSFVLGPQFLLTFQEAEGDVFDGVRTRMLNSTGRIRTLGVDYLLFALLDAITDHYYYITEKLELKIETEEDLLFCGTLRSETSNQIQSLKTEVLKVRRQIFPMREILNRIDRTSTHLITEHTIHFFRDVSDHLTQITESIEIYREMIWSLMDMHMTALSNKMNEVMKVLTIIATIFIPLTFIAGVYGMNFDHMPELHYKYSYYVLWGIMIALFVALLLYFKKKRWL